MSKPETQTTTSFFCMCGSRTPGFHYPHCPAKENFMVRLAQKGVHPVDLSRISEMNEGA
jgi:hypothetical protein